MLLAALVALKLHQQHNIALCCFPRQPGASKPTCLTQILLLGQCASGFQLGSSNIFRRQPALTLEDDFSVCRFLTPQNCPWIHRISKTHAQRCGNCGQRPEGARYGYLIHKNGFGPPKGISYFLLVCLCPCSKRSS